MSASAALAALCISSGVLSAVVPTTAFGLQWMHSIEKTQWFERWTVTPHTLVLERALTMRCWWMVCIVTT